MDGMFLSQISANTQIIYHVTNNKSQGNIDSDIE